MHTRELCISGYAVRIVEEGFQVLDSMCFIVFAAPFAALIDFETQPDGL